MMEWVKTYLIDIGGISGGFQIQVSYTMMIAIAWICTLKLKRVFSKKQPNQQLGAADQDPPLAFPNLRDKIMNNLIGLIAIAAVGAIIAFGHDESTVDGHKDPPADTKVRYYKDSYTFKYKNGAKVRTDVNYSLQGDREVHPTAYEDIKDIQDNYPKLRPRLKEAYKDNMISNSEYSELSDARWIAENQSPKHSQQKDAFTASMLNN